MLPRHVLTSSLVALLGSWIGSAAGFAETISHRQAREAMHRAVDFFRQHAASEGGGYVYRTDAQQGKRNLTTLDDDKSQSAVRFLMRLDHTLGFENKRVHESVRYALEAFLRAQYANGAWPQRYSDFSDPEAHPPRQARFPDQWPREFPGRDYKAFYTLNDNTMSDMIETMLLAHGIYQDPRYLEAAKQAGDFFLRAQLPAPQPGWAQQYDQQMQPAWARKFEPPAITGGESQGVMLTLMRLYRASGEKKYLEPIPRAVAYYRGLLLPDGQLARFYELGTDRPLYFSKDYELTYSDDDMPTHYGFKVGSKLDAIERHYEQLIDQPPSPRYRLADLRPQPPRPRALRGSDGPRSRARQGMRGRHRAGTAPQPTISRMSRRCSCRP